MKAEAKPVSTGSEGGGPPAPQAEPDAETYVAWSERPDKAPRARFWRWIMLPTQGGWA